MKNFIFLLVVFTFNLVQAQSPNQYESIDKKMDDMPDSFENSTIQIIEYINANFTSIDDKIRAAFYWTASTIDYDVENMLNQKPNQTPQQKIDAVLQTKKGVCMHYAEVFSDLMNKLNVKTVLVEGYTKQGGKVVDLGHVWCASKINENWFLFDPTWASGFVSNDIFYKKINNIYYKASAKSFITNHMPFDYLWQFSEFPITNQEFYDGKILSENSNERFDYIGKINALDSLSDFEKCTERANRIEKNGLKNKLIIESLNYEKAKIKNFKSKDNYITVSQIIANFNEANSLYNDFIKYRNNRFIPLVSDSELKNKIQIPNDMLLKCISDINAVKDINKENVYEINDFKKAMNSAKILFTTQLNFVTEYLAKDALARQKMFYKTTVVRKKTN
jgi:hypothetical protein